MTRRMIYRIALATLMLPNFTAYWWLLPRRMKRIRTAIDAILWRMNQEVIRQMAEDHDKYLRFAEFCRSGMVEKISERDFRLPFQVTK